VEHDQHDELDDDHAARLKLGYGLDAEEQFFVVVKQPALSHQKPRSQSPKNDVFRARSLNLLLAVVLLAQAPSGNAPGDAYFGRLSMSALRIRYETMQLRKRYETHQLLPQDAEHLLLLTEDAYLQWARRYPNDAWLPSTGFGIAGLYEELPGATARAHAIALLTYIASHFPKSSYAYRSRAQLHRGVSTKPFPAWARPTPTPTPALPPLPSPVTSPSPSPTGV